MARVTTEALAGVEAAEAEVVEVEGEATTTEVEDSVKLVLAPQAEAAVGILMEVHA